MVRWNEFGPSSRPPEVEPEIRPSISVFAVLHALFASVVDAESVASAIVGAVPNTTAPVPVSPVTAAAKFAVEGVARKVATPVPSPATPVDMGSPVAFVRVPDDGVPSAPPFTTNAPAVPTFTPSAVATPVPSPEMPVETGRPVAFVRMTADGVPRAGVTSVGDVARTTSPVPVQVNKEEVATAEGTAEPPVLLPSTEFAAIAARPIEALVPPTWAPSVPDVVVSPFPTASDEVAITCSAPVPAPYTRLPEVNDVAPVPPPATVRVPVIEGVKV